jgi:inorganic phosphate transporter, PiT family
MGLLMPYLPLGGGLFLGWTLGANDAANVFGTAVGSRILPFWKVAFYCGFFVIAGALLQGGEGIETLSGITDQTIATAVVVSVAAALTGFMMTLLQLPISTSQAVVGAILGIGLSTGNTEYGGLIKVVLCWVGTPFGSMLFAVLLYKLAALGFRFLPLGILTRDKLLHYGLILVGLYGSYALGANNVANTIGMFSGLLPGMSDHMLAGFGGFAIALGVITFSYRVMMRVGRGIMTLDAYTAFIAVLSMSLTVHIFAVAGAPVSTSQGIVGSIIGIGLLRGMRNIRFRVLRDIALGWVFTPAIALVLAAAGYAIFLS